MHKNRKLKNYLVFPKFQLTLVGVNLFIMTVCYGLVFYQVYDSFAHLTQVGVRLKLPADSAFFKLIDHQQNAIQSKLILAAAISYLVSFVLTVIISHRVSGPLFRLKSYFIDMKENGYSKDLNFRDNDYYSELPEVINQAIREIKD
jgi:hypothetical protein